MEEVKIHREKRLFDIMISFFVLIVLFPFIVLILLVMSIEYIFIPSSRGSFLYTETRISQGKPFTLYKFRIFKRGALKDYAQSNGNFIDTKKLERDRYSMTYVGRMLKQVYLDELPQLINVLKGDMSLVGPRPTNITNYERGLRYGRVSRKIAKAGITGYFQSHKGQALLKNQEALDMEYINFCKMNPGWRIILYDIKILLITFLTVLRAEGV